MNRKLIVLIVLGLILLTCLATCGYFGMKAIRNTRLRRAGMEAYEKKEYQLAELLLQQYVKKDPNAEAEFVALANIYHEFGNTGMEAQMWQTASALNPLNTEYYEKMLTSAIQSASYALLHGNLGQKARIGEQLSNQELFLYVISSYRSGYQKDGDNAYKNAVKVDSEAFHKDELGRMAEFMVNYSNMSENEREDYLNEAMVSENPVIRFEAILTAVRRAAQEDNNETDYEDLLKQLAETNYYAGTPFLADYLFSKNRFEDVISILEPYLKTIDDVTMYLLYAESCVFTEKMDELKALEKKLRRKSGFLPILADYCNILIAYLENDEEKLATAIRKSGKLVNSPLSRFMRLRVAMESKSMDEIRTVAQEIFSNPPFHDLSNRALVICLDYISGELKKPENQKDPSRLADLAKILSGYLQGNRMLTEIILMDQYKKGLVKEEVLMAALEEFPDDALLQRITAEYLILNGKSEQAMSIIEQILSAMEGADMEPDHAVRFLHMLALDQLERRDEAAIAFQKLIEQSEFDLELLSQYFQFCVTNKRTADLQSMADKLVSVKDGKLEHFGKFFHAAALFTMEDEEKENEALDLLASTPTGDPDFTLYAANRLCEYDRFDEAEAKYKAILKTYKTPALILINLSELYHEKGDKAKALESAKEAFDMEKKSMLPAFIYAKRLSETERYEDAVRTLNFPRRAVNYRKDVIDLWTDCMRHVIENSMSKENYPQAEDQLKHLLVVAPDDEFGKETMEKVRELLKTNKDKPRTENASAVPAA